MANVLNFARNRFRDILYKASFGTGGDITKRTKTRKLDNKGRVTDISKVDTTIKGFLSVVTPNDTKLLKEGILQVGEGQLFTEHNVTLNPQKDSVVILGNEWEIVSEMAAPVIKGGIVHHTYKARRRDEE